MADPEFFEPPKEMMDELVKFQEERDGEPLGKVGNRVLYEDDKVRIWEMDLRPGEASDLHHHALDYYLVMLEGDVIGGVPPKSSGQKPYVAKLPNGGTTVSVSRGDTEWAVNCGKERFYEILVELKE